MDQKTETDAAMVPVFERLVQISAITPKQDEIAIHWSDGELFLYGSKTIYDGLDLDADVSMLCQERLSVVSKFINQAVDKKKRSVKIRRKTAAGAVDTQTAYRINNELCILVRWMVEHATNLPDKLQLEVGSFPKPSALGDFDANKPNALIIFTPELESELRVWLCGDAINPDGTGNWEPGFEMDFDVDVAMTSPESFAGAPISLLNQLLDDIVIKSLGGDKVDALPEPIDNPTLETDHIWPDAARDRARGALSVFEVAVEEAIRSGELTDFQKSSAIARIDAIKILLTDPEPDIKTLARIFKTIERMATSSKVLTVALAAALLAIDQILETLGLSSIREMMKDE